MRFYEKSELRQLITYRGEGLAEWALWIGDVFLFHQGGEVIRMQHYKDDLGLPSFKPYKDPVL